MFFLFFNALLLFNTPNWSSLPFSLPSSLSPYLSPSPSPSHSPPPHLANTGRFFFSFWPETLIDGQAPLPTLESRSHLNESSLGLQRIPVIWEHYGPSPAVSLGNSSRAAELSNHHSAVSMLKETLIPTPYLLAWILLFKFIYGFFRITPRLCPSSCSYFPTWF